MRMSTQLIAQTSPGRERAKPRFLALPSNPRTGISTSPTASNCSTWTHTHAKRRRYIRVSKTKPAASPEVGEDSPLYCKGHHVISHICTTHDLNDLSSAAPASWCPQPQLLRYCAFFLFLLILWCVRAVCMCMQVLDWYRREFFFSFFFFFLFLLLVSRGCMCA